MFIIKENFYRDPINVRNTALSWDFNVVGNFPGVRTPVCAMPYFEEIQKDLSAIINRKIVHWPKEYNTSFQLTLENSKTWVHRDKNEWAAVVYLSPDAPIESGTGIYRHKQTKIMQHLKDTEVDYNLIETKEEDWELVTFAGNIFNRIVLYEGNYYHRSVLPGFGTSKETGRLFQTFFFDTEAY
jgi:hypothetical protein